MAQYTKNPPMTERDLLADPLAQIERWIADAAAAGMQEPMAMTLATVSGNQPSARIVLYKGMHEGRLTFYTNYQGRKGSELAHNARVALVFWWDKLERQIRVEGSASKLPPEMSEQYFASRPRASQLGALASQQSAPIATREELDQRLDALTHQYENQAVPHPAHWGGYGVTPQVIEFWQGRRDRLHDRIVYTRASAGWSTARLQP